MNWVQYKDLLCYLCVCGLVVSSLSLTQEILGSSPTLPFLYFINFFLSLNSANSVKTFRENSIHTSFSSFTGSSALQEQSVLKVSYSHGQKSMKLQQTQVFIAMGSVVKSMDIA